MRIFFFGLFLIAYILLSNNIYGTPKSELRFIAIGHSYPVIKDSIQQMELINHINCEDSIDYVFFLGDCSIWDSLTLKRYKKYLKWESVFVAGNHDASGADRRAEYIKGVKYFYNKISTKNCDFYIINSHDSIQAINRFLSKAIEYNSKKKIILSHARIWDDNLTSSIVNGHDKSYLYSELDTEVMGGIDYIIAGNSPRQYFGDQNRNEKSKVNSRINYWCDQVDSIICYSVGISANLGMANNRVTYCLFSINEEKELFVNPRSFTLNKQNLFIPIDYNQLKFLKNPTKFFIYNIKKYLFFNIRYPYNIFNGILIVLLIILVFYLKRKR
jgi:calcineurin-like phosphoesterase family protein